LGVSHGKIYYRPTRGLASNTTRRAD
jgi:hypothetical protein